MIGLSTRTSILTLLLTLTWNAAGSEKQRIAVMQLDGKSATELELTLVSHILRSSVVNTGRFSVLERENIDRVLHEQSMQTIGVVSEGDAARVGRILNVHKIVIGTLMRYHAGYFLEARLIDVETSTIDRSRTATCVSTDSLPELARLVADGLCGSESAVVPQTGVAAASRFELRPDDSAAVPEAQGRTLAAWRVIGFSAYDYQRFTTSGLSVAEWTVREHRSPVAAGILGLTPCASGLFYTRSIGGGMFLTMAKILAVVGISRSLWEGGDNDQALWMYGSLLGGVTVADVIGSVYSASRYNARIKQLAESKLAVELNLNGKTAQARMSCAF